MPMYRFAHMQKSELISAAEAAEILGLTRATFNRRAANGLIPAAVEMPGRTGARLFDRDKIETLAAEAAA